jgi:hypothetical protein
LEQLQADVGLNKKVLLMLNKTIIKDHKLLAKGVLVQREVKDRKVRSTLKTTYIDLKNRCKFDQINANRQDP